MWNGSCLPGSITSHGFPLTQGRADCSRLLPGLFMLFLRAHTLSPCLLSRVFLCLQSTHQIPSSLRPLIQDFPGGPVVKTALPLQGHGFSPLSGKFHMLHSEGKKKKTTLIQTPHPSTSSGSSLRSLATSSSEGPLALLSRSSKSSFPTCHLCCCLL